MNPADFSRVDLALGLLWQGPEYTKPGLDRRRAGAMGPDFA